MDEHNDLYLRSTLEMNPYPTTPGPSVALDTLLHLGKMELKFQYCFVDKPRAGTSALIWHDPSRQTWPSDGIRYMPSNSSITGEKFTTNAHSLSNDSSNSVELETGVITAGIFPPANPAIPVSKDSPDLQLARFRIRWRIITPGVGNPCLWLVYWGRDERTTQRAPAGWEREPIRRYPLPIVAPDQPVEIPLQRGVSCPFHEVRLLHQPMQYSGHGAGSPPPPSMQHYTPQQQHQLQHQQQQQKMRQPSSNATPSYPSHQLPPNMQQQQQQAGQQQQPSNYPMGFQPGRQPSMPLAPSTGPPAQVNRQNTPKSQPLNLARRQATANGKPPTQTPPQQHAIAGPSSASSSSHPQSLPPIPPQLRNSLLASAAHASFPLQFSDPYDYLSSRSWAGLRYENNHALVGPIFDPSTTGELIESWLEPSYPDLDKIKEEISLLQKEVEELKTKQSKLSFGNAPVASTSSSTDLTVSSHQLARKGSLASSSSTAVVHKEKEAMTGGAGVESLLAPLPRMMPIAEMQDKAMQAHNARRKEIEEALQAARAAKEEEERLEREKMEAIEAAKKAEEDAIREKERREREEKEMEERKRREEEEEVERLTKAEADADLKRNESSKREVMQNDGEEEMRSSNATQTGADMNTAPSPRKSSNASNQYGEPGGVGGGTGASGEGYFDDSYNLLMDNNFGMYGGDENDGENGYSNGDDAVMLDNSLFAEYMDQMGSM